MACSGFRSRNFHLCGTLTVTIPNDSVSRSRKAPQDPPEGEQPLHKRPHWEGFCGSPPPPKRAAPQPALLSSAPGSRAAPPAYALTSGRCKDDSDLDASLLEPSDGEEPDSPWRLSMEEEAKLLEDDPGDDVDPFPPFVLFGVKTKKQESSCFPAPQSVPEALQATLRAESLPSTSPSELCSVGLPRKGTAMIPGHGRHLHRGPRNSSSPAFPEAVPVEAESVSPEKEGRSSTSGGEGAACAGRDPSAVGRPTAGEAAHLMLKRSVRDQASVVQELGGKRAGQPSQENEGEPGPASLHGKAATSHPDSASSRSEYCLKNSSSTKRPKSPTRPRQQIHIRQADLEGSLKSYINTVLAHVHNNPVLGPVNELHALMQRVSSERHSQGHAFKHPADLTMRNYAERTNRPAQRYTLSQWVARNQHDRPPFADIPERFERSPVPSL